MWVSRSYHRFLLRQLVRANHRAETAEARLEDERMAKDAMLRHWGNQLLTKAGRFGQSDRPAPTPPAPRLPTPIDPGWREAVYAEARRLGVSDEEVEKKLQEMAN